MTLVPSPSTHAGSGPLLVERLLDRPQLLAERAGVHPFGRPTLRQLLDRRRVRRVIDPRSASSGRQARRKEAARRPPWEDPGVACDEGVQEVDRAQSRNGWARRARRTQPAVSQARAASTRWPLAQPPTALEMMQRLLQLPGNGQRVDDGVDAKVAIAPEARGRDVVGGTGDRRRTPAAACTAHFTPSWFPLAQNARTMARILRAGRLPQAWPVTLSNPSATAKADASIRLFGSCGQRGGRSEYTNRCGKCRTSAAIVRLHASVDVNRPAPPSPRRSPAGRRSARPATSSAAAPSSASRVPVTSWNSLMRESRAERGHMHVVAAHLVARALRRT